jgi:hypothetical protein
MAHHEFYPWVLHPVAHLPNLVFYDAVNRNKVPICQLSLFIFLPLTTCFGPYRPSSCENIQLIGLVLIKHQLYILT